MIELKPRAWGKMNGRLDNAAFPLMIITAAVPNFPRPPFGVGFWDMGVYFGNLGGLQVAATTLGITHLPAFPE